MSNASQNSLLKFFALHLDRIYCGKQHLVNSMPVLAEHASFGDLKLAILELRDDVRKQIARMNEIYKILKIEQSDAGCVGMTALLQEAFEGIDTNNGDKPLCDLSLMFYLQNIEGIEAASFQMLKLTAKKLGNEEVNNLLAENLDEAKDDRGLLLQISKAFLATKGL